MSTITQKHVEDLAFEFYQASPRYDERGAPLPWASVDQSVRAELINASRVVMERFEYNLRDGIGKVISHHRDAIASLYQSLASVAEIAGSHIDRPERAVSAMAEIRAITQRGLSAHSTLH